MSDYLSRIAERAGSARAAVRPVLPSLFEPVKPGAAIARVTAAHETEPIFGIEHDAEPTGETGTPNQSIHDRVASIQPIWTTAVTSATPSKSEEPSKRKSADLPRSPSTEPAVQGFAVEPVVVKEAAIQSSDKEPAIWPRAVQPIQFAQKQPVIDGSKHASHLPGSAEPTPAIPSVVIEPAATTHGRHSQSPAVALVPRVPIASPGHARPTTSFAAAAAADSSPTPTIHVTIGRVEVRAIMQPAQVSQPRERPAPKMSLDDYLRSRNGGGA